MKRIGDMMKKLLMIPLLILLFACGSASDPIVQEAESTVTITAPDGYAVACTTNFVRVQPHFCASTVSFVESFTVSTSGSCQSYTLTTVPSSAKMVLARMQILTRGANVLNTSHNSWFNSYTDASCVNWWGSFGDHRTEVPAVSTVTSVINLQAVQVLPVVSGTIRYFHDYVCVSCGSHSTGVYIIGYYD